MLQENRNTKTIKKNTGTNPKDRKSIHPFDFLQLPHLELPEAIPISSAIQGPASVLKLQWMLKVHSHVPTIKTKT